MKIFKSILLISVFWLTSCSHEVTPKEKSNPYLKMGNKYFIDKQWLNAITYYKKARKKDPSSREATKKIAISYYNIQNYYQSIQLLDKIYQSEKKVDDTIFYLADSYRKTGNHSKAIFFYKLYLDENKKHLESLQGLAWSYYSIKYYKGALNVSRSIIKQDSKDVYSLLLIAKIYNKVGLLKRSEKILKKAEYYADESNIVYVLSAKGQLFFERGQYFEAKKYLKKALDIQPFLESALLYYSKCLLEEKQNVEKAMEYLKRVVRLNSAQTEGYYLLIQNKKYLNEKEIKKYKKRFKKLSKFDPEYISLPIDKKTLPSPKATSK